VIGALHVVAFVGWVLVLSISGLSAIAATGAGEGSEPGLKTETEWCGALLALRAAPPPPDGELGAEGPVWEALERRFPVPCDWALQDGGRDFPRGFLGPRAGDVLREMAGRAIEEAGEAAGGLRADLDAVSREGSGEIPAVLALYARACELRRERRLTAILRQAPRIVFAKHRNLGGSHYAYTEGLSDAQGERHFRPGASLCVLEMRGTRADVRTLLDTREGCIRDPAVDFDGRRILFSWKKSDREDDFHLYEMDAETCEVRQITSGLGFADYEGCYLPDGDILFNSTRPVQSVDCWYTEVSNLYRCGRDGRRLVRLTFDQVHDNYPTVLDDGRTIYTRWEYSDRGQIYPQGLFEMRPDGTGQTAFYGNNSWFPTSILHARGIPGTTSVLGIIAGHHTLQMGKLAVIDTGRGTEENLGVQLIAPVRETKAERVDAYGQDGDLFQYPYPISEDEFLVGHSPLGTACEKVRFAVYWMDRDGRREILAADPGVSSTQPVPLAPRPRPPAPPSPVDRGLATSLCFLQDVHYGAGLAGVARGEVKKLRVVALEYRAAAIRHNFSLGAGGDSEASTPVSIGNGSWDVKRVLGEATVRADGSALFEVPARTPVYFQALDSRGRILQTMRSWATLQPGERASCSGCHEAKAQAPRAGAPPLALRSPPERLDRGARGFSFPREVQPILDRHCISCHRRGEEETFSLEGTATPEGESGRAWSDSYLSLTAAKPFSLYGFPPALCADPEGPFVRWVAAQSGPPMLEPRSTGAVRSPLLDLLEKGHKDVRLAVEEIATIALWIDLAVPYCGDYEEAAVWNEEERAKYRGFLEKRRRMEEIERKGIEEIRSGRETTAF
jgi:hypothetical protein